MTTPSKINAPSPLLDLLNERFKTLGLGEDRQHRAPSVAPDHLASAVRLYARTNPSDPFAAKRMNMHIQRGIALASDVIADANAQLRARGQTL